MKYIKCAALVALVVIALIGFFFCAASAYMFLEMLKTPKLPDSTYLNLLFSACVSGVSTGGFLCMFGYTIGEIKSIFKREVKS